MAPGVGWSTYPWLSHERPARSRVVCASGHRESRTRSPPHCTALHAGPGPEFHLVTLAQETTSCHITPRAAPGGRLSGRGAGGCWMLAVRSACGDPARSAVVCQLSITAVGGRQGQSGARMNDLSGQPPRPSANRGAGSAQTPSRTRCRSHRRDDNLSVPIAGGMRRGRRSRESGRDPDYPRPGLRTTPSIILMHAVATKA